MYKSHYTEFFQEINIFPRKYEKYFMGEGAAGITPHPSFGGASGSPPPYKRLFFAFFQEAVGEDSQPGGAQYAQQGNGLPGQGI